jgi:hypothetical protein
MIRTIRMISLVGAAGLALMIPASAAMAANATGCSGSVVSTDKAGAVLGTATAPGEGGTQAKPLPIDTAGQVAWTGSTDAVITDGKWTVTVGGAPFLSGTFANTDGATTAEGVQDMSSLPSLLGSMLTNKMVVPVAGEVTGSGGTCSADGYITGVASPTSSPVFYAGAVVGGIGIAMAVGVIAGTKAAAGAAAASGGGGVA